MLRTPLTTRRLAVLALVALLSAAPVAWAQCASSKADKAHCGAGKQMAETPAATDAKAMTPSPGEPAAAGTIAEVAASTGTFNTLLAAAEQAGLAEALAGEGPITVFAPTDEAFKHLPPATLKSLLAPENKAELQKVLKHHIFAGRVQSAKALKLGEAESLAETRLFIHALPDGTPGVNEARIVSPDIRASNGVIHVIDRALVPRADLVATAAEAGTFKTLLAAAKAAGLAESLSEAGPLTLFAPNDKAFAALPAGTVESLLKPENRQKLQAILKYHVAPGWLHTFDKAHLNSIQTLGGGYLPVYNASMAHWKVVVAQTRIAQPNVEAGNGVIHVIDKVLLPPPDAMALAGERPELSTLTAAIKAAGLDKALASAGPVTILAPSDEAFEALPAGTVENLLKPENREQLTALLKRHVVQGFHPSVELLSRERQPISAETLGGESIELTAKEGRVHVAGAGVQEADILASNAIIHVIDAVLVPEPPDVARSEK
mgnify:CR=1 FL=1